jgi:RHS repeat-associated protein
MSAGDFTGRLQVREKGGQDSIYISSIGRFAQPDTLVPGAANPQNFNRYTYVLNSPINFTDPSGYFCEGGHVLDGMCVDNNTTQGQINSYTSYQAPGASTNSSSNMSSGESSSQSSDRLGTGGETFDDSPTGRLKKEIREKFGVAFDPNDTWTEKELKTVLSALTAIAKTLASYTQVSNDPFVIFRMVFNSGWPYKPILFDKVNYLCEQGCWGKTVSSHEIRWYSNAKISVGLVVHEMGHAFNASLNSDPYNQWDSLSVEGKPADKSGFEGGVYQGYFSEYTDTGEQFADNFVGLVLGTFSDDRAGRVRYEFMDSNMPAWVAMGLFGP